MNCKHSEKTLPQPMIKDTTVTQDTNTKRSPNEHISRGGKAKNLKLPSSQATSCPLDTWAQKIFHFKGMQYQKIEKYS